MFGRMLITIFRAYSLKYFSTSLDGSENVDVINHNNSQLTHIITASTYRVHQCIN